MKNYFFAHIIVVTLVMAFCSLSYVFVINGDSLSYESNNYRSLDSIYAVSSEDESNVGKLISTTSLVTEDSLNHKSSTTLELLEKSLESDFIDFNAFSSYMAETHNPRCFRLLSKSFDEFLKRNDSIDVLETYYDDNKASPNIKLIYVEYLLNEYYSVNGIDIHLNCYPDND